MYRGAIFSLAFTCAICVQSVAWSEEQICATRDDLADACYETRGRIQYYNGTPGMRMWKVGTNRLLGLMGGEGSAIAPKELGAYIIWGVQVFGDFIVCPFEKDKPGWMQPVCIESAKNIRIEDYRDDFDSPKIEFLEGPFTLSQD